MASLIRCPQCGTPIEITQALESEIESQVLAKVSKKHEEDLETVKKTAIGEAIKELEEENRIEITDLKKALAEREEKLHAMQEAELKLREEKRRLEDKEKELEIETARKLDQGRKEIQEETLRKAEEQSRLKFLEKDKQINDLKASLDEAQRKANVSSQQLQGEVLELDLEENLKIAFPQDSIEPVGKGVRGADIRQTVKSPKQGAVCGVILWESKRTKAWSDEWLTKLKDDLRSEEANIPVIVTSVMPKSCSDGFGYYEGVYVVNFGLVLPLATLLRRYLTEVAYQKYISADAGKKADMIYGYLTSHVFRQQIEALIEVFNEMSFQIVKERTAFEKSWKVREAQVYRLMTNTAKIYGSLQGLAGNALPPIKDLELPQLE